MAKTGISHSRTMTNQQQDQEEDFEFLQFDESDKYKELGGQEHLNQALGGSNGEHWEDISFNVFDYCHHMGEHSIAYLFYKICKHFNF